MTQVDPARLDLRAKYLREGKSRNGLALEIQVPEQSLRRYERGEGVHPRNAVPIAKYLGVDVTDLPQFATQIEEPAT